jgi:hypothetical protein
MAEIKPPLVFLGPSVSIAEARAILPQAEYCAPATRGDLYNARSRNTSIFVLIDGVFLQSYAPSPRELVDVVRDGALVIGAASLGALRAAECWPAGVRGVGLIYRLFRSGCLVSDEEVAVTYDGQAHRPISIPMVNVRYSTHRAVKAGLLAPSDGERLVQAAESIFYPERTWRAVFSSAAINVDPDCRRFLESMDLKKSDALRALRLVARLLEHDSHLAERYLRKTDAPFEFTEHVREPAADPTAGIASDKLTQELAVWLLSTGRFRRYIFAVVGAGSLRELLGDFDRFAASLWSELERNGELDAELFRRLAVRQLLQDSSLPSPVEINRAEHEILRQHGFKTWDELEEWAEKLSLPREWFAEARVQISRARFRRDQLFAM